MNIRKMSSSVNRILFLLTIVLMADLIVGQESTYFRDGLQFRQRTKSRDVRGFRPAKLSTADGYGKRGDISGSSTEILDDQQYDQKFPMFWILEKMKNHPESMKKLERSLEKDGDERISAIKELFKSIKLVSII